MRNSESSKMIYIEGKRIFLRQLLKSDFTSEYLSWLNDPEVNKYSQRRPFPASWEDMKEYNEYYAKHPKEGFVLAVIARKNKTHIGNISLVNIQRINRCAEIAILIGNRRYWNKGYAAEAIYNLTKHGFEELGLHKIFAGSFNPAFIKCVEKLGWRREGEFRERIWSHGRYHTQVWCSMLEPEFRIIEAYEK